MMRLKRFRHPLIFCALATFALGGLSTDAFAQWDLNDVTYLFPLPNSANLTAAIRAMDPASDGKPILPRPVLVSVSGDFGRFGALMPGNVLPRSESFDLYRDLFAVSLRIDPCFKDQFSEKCRRQIRIVWQPVDHWQENAPESIDAAVHTFYDLSKTQFSSLLEGLQVLKRVHGIRTQGLPLGIHPGFSRDKASSFQKDFRALILPYIGSERIRRMAIMKLASFSAGWDLFSSDFVGEKRVPVRIFPGGDTTQILENRHGISALQGGTIDGTTGAQVAAELISRRAHGPDRRAFLGLVSPQSDEGDQLLAFIADSDRALRTDEGRTAFSRAVRIEDPNRHLPGTVDCASCHVANAVKTLVQSATPGLLAPPPVFKGAYDLKNGSKYYGSTHQLRMLGYLHEEPQIADRVIYESAAVADLLNEMTGSNRDLRRLNQRQ